MENVTYYAVKVNNTIISQPYADTFAAEQHKRKLNESEQNQARIVQVTESGQELLFG